MGKEEVVRRGNGGTRMSKTRSRRTRRGKKKKRRMK